VDGVVPRGEHTAEFDARGLPGGAYIYRLQTSVGDISRTMHLVN